MTGREVGATYAAIIPDRQQSFCDTDLRGDRSRVALLLHVMHRLAGTQFLERPASDAVAVKIELRAPAVEDEAVIVAGLDFRHFPRQRRSAGRRRVLSLNSLERLQL